MCCGARSWYDDYTMEDGTSWNPNNEIDSEKVRPNRNCAMLHKTASQKDR
jgi:hypothetical protein